MSKKDKLIDKMINSPKNIRFDDMRNLLLYFGFVERHPRSGSSHYTFKYNDCIITVPKQNPVNQIYVIKIM